MKLFCEAFIKFLIGVLLTSAFLFLPAGDFSYPQAWRLIVVLFGTVFVVGVVMFIKSPELLRKRLNKEGEKEQKWIVAISAAMFVLGFALAGLTFRFKLLMLPDWVSWAGVTLLLSSYIIYIEVLRENKYLSRAVEVQEGQQVVSRGLYGVVRHPMYGTSILMFISMALILGSIPTIVIFLIYPIIIAKRIRGEEALLEKELPGYVEYKQKVRYKIIPFIW